MVVPRILPCVDDRGDDVSSVIVPWRFVAAIEDKSNKRDVEGCGIVGEC